MFHRLSYDPSVYNSTVLVVDIARKYREVRSFIASGDYQFPNSDCNTCKQRGNTATVGLQSADNKMGTHFRMNMKLVKLS